MKIHYDFDVLPEDHSQLPKFNFDVFKWHLFFSNLTEGVFQVLKQTFEFILDYKRELKFQILSEETDAVTAEPIPSGKVIPENDELLKGHFLCAFSFCAMAYPYFFYHDITSILFQGAYQKLSARAKGTTVCQVLTGTVLLNFHHLHPEFQKFILERIQTVYKTKKEIQSDVTFFLIVSVSKFTLYF